MPAPSSILNPRRCCHLCTAAEPTTEMRLKTPATQIAPRRPNPRNLVIGSVIIKPSTAPAKNGAPTMAPRSQSLSQMTTLESADRGAIPEEGPEPVGLPRSFKTLIAAPRTMSVANFGTKGCNFTGHSCLIPTSDVILVIFYNEWKYALTGSSQRIYKQLSEVGAILTGFSKFPSSLSSKHCIEPQSRSWSTRGRQV